MVSGEGEREGGRDGGMLSRRGVRERMWISSSLVYGGKWMCGMEEVERRRGEGAERMKIVVKKGTYDD